VRDRGRSGMPVTSVAPSGVRHELRLLSHFSAGCSSTPVSIPSETTSSALQGVAGTFRLDVLPRPKPPRRSGSCTDPRHRPTLRLTTPSLALGPLGRRGDQFVLSKTTSPLPRSRSVVLTPASSQARVWTWRSSLLLHQASWTWALRGRGARMIASTCSKVRVTKGSV
jgi:hypothetical protein